MAGRVLLKIVYVLTCRVLALIVVLSHGDQATVAEMLVLRHENAVLRRQVSLSGPDHTTCPSRHRRHLLAFLTGF